MGSVNVKKDILKLKMVHKLVKNVKKLAKLVRIQPVVILVMMEQLW